MKKKTETGEMIARLTLDDRVFQKQLRRVSNRVIRAAALMRAAIDTLGADVESVDSGVERKPRAKRQRAKA